MFFTDENNQIVTTCTVGKLSITPDEFFFATITDAPVDTVMISNEVTITGLLGSGAPISTIEGEYSINGCPWTRSTRTVHNGDRVKMRLTSGSCYPDIAIAMLMVGHYKTAFTVRTASC